MKFIEYLASLKKPTLILVLLTISVVFGDLYDLVNKKEDFMNEDVKVVKRLDDDNDGRVFKHFIKPKKIIKKKRIAVLQVVRPEFDIEEFRKNQRSLENGAYKNNSSKIKEFILRTVERFNIKKDANPKRAAAFSGNFEIEGKTVLGFTVTSSNPKVEIYSDNPVTIANNFAFTYELDGTIYSALLTKQKGGQEYIINLQSGPYANTKLIFSTQEELTRIYEKSVREEFKPDRLISGTQDKDRQFGYVPAPSNIPKNENFEEAEYGDQEEAVNARNQLGIENVYEKPADYHDDLVMSENGYRF